MNKYDDLSESFKLMVEKPKNENELKNWEIALFDTMELSTGVAWSADIMLNGELATKVENCGNGSCNNYYDRNKALWEAFVVDASKAYPEHSEPLDFFTTYLDVMANYHFPKPSVKKKLKK